MLRPTLSTALWFGLLTANALAGEVVVEGRTFRLPDGFVVEKVAGPPLVDRPIVADFDELGRLYVADSSGSNDNVKKQEAERPHRIVRLEDSDGDGKFDRSIVFADKMMFPEGAMWLEGSLYVSAPPSIWKLTDTDGDGKADRREEWFQGKTLTGCANDLHGPYAGPDGWIYWCKGAFASQTYERPGRKPLVTRAAHIFRARPDGTGIEPVMTGGMDNPVDVVFTPEGERIFTTTFLQHPGGGRRDGLIHALYGGVYGKIHDVIDGHPRTGPDVLPPLVHLGPAAPAGLARAESDALGSRDNLFTACFNLRKVARTRLTPQGGTFNAETDDFLATDDLDFHPTDVQEDADGSLLVVDTGGWYKLCCPTSQIVKPDVLGGIYRVRRKDAPKVEDPRGLKISWSILPLDTRVAYLGDPRPAVRRRAVAVLLEDRVNCSQLFGMVMEKGTSAEARRAAAWGVCRVNDPVSRWVIRTALSSADPSVRQIAIHAAGLWRDRQAWPKVAESLKNPSPAVRRSAAEALGRIGEPQAIPALLDAASSEEDWALRHSLTYALIEIADPIATRIGLTNRRPLVQVAALIALDQMEGGLTRDDAHLLLLYASDPTLRRTLLWIIGRHPDWDAPVAFLEGRLSSKGLAPADLEELEDQLAKFAKSPPVQKLLAGSATSPKATSEVRQLALRSMARSGLKEMPEAWQAALGSLLNRDDVSLTRQILATLRGFTRAKSGDPNLAAELRRIATSDGHPDDVRLASFAVLQGNGGATEPEPFAFLLGQLAQDRPVSSRTSAADIFARAGLDGDQYAKLAGALASAGPLELPRLLDAFDRARGDEIGLKLVDALKKSPARSTLRVDTLKPRLARFGPGVKQEAETLYRSIEADSADRQGQLEALLGHLSGGDIRRGQVIFNGPKAACVTCHAIGYVGGKLGPDLTKIGQVRAERDLLESIVFPSASFVRSYEPVAVATRDGKVVSGLLRKDAPDEVIVAVAADRDERIGRDQVEEVRPGTVSVMPAGLDKQLTPGELADLIAFLKACR